MNFKSCVVSELEKLDNLTPDLVDKITEKCKKKNMSYKDFRLQRYHKEAGSGFFGKVLLITFIIFGLLFVKSLTGNNLNPVKETHNPMFDKQDVPNVSLGSDCSDLCSGGKGYCAESLTDKSSCFKSSSPEGVNAVFWSADKNCCCYCSIG